MTVGNLKRIIQNIPDDFTIEMRVRKRITKDEISKRKYAYPFDTLYTKLEYDDIGYSDRQLCLGCEIPAPSQTEEAQNTVGQQSRGGE